MSLFPCSACGARRPGKLAQATWAWWRSDNVRKAYRQRLCMDCFVRNVAPLEVATRDYSTNCPCCHIDTSDDMDPVYLTVYVPSVGPVRLEMPTCPVHAAEIRIRAQVGAQELEDSSSGAASPSPRTDASDAWSALGIEPRAA